MWGAIAAAVAPAVVGGLIGGQASRQAASMQADSADRATESQRAMFERQLEMQAPFREAGVTSQNRLMELLGLGGSSTAPDYGSLLRDFSMADYQADPGYQFRQAEGMRGIENSAAARGGLLSGGALKGIQRFGQDLASQEFGNAYQRFKANQTDRYNKLAGVVNTGQGATNQLTSAAGNLGTQIGQNITGAGNANAAGAVGQANAWTNAIGQGYNMYQQNQLMDLIRNPRVSNAGGSGATTYRGSQQTNLLNSQWDPTW